MGIITITTPSEMVSAAPQGGGTGLANLLTADPREIWVAASASASLIYDLGDAQAFDTIFLGFTNAQPGATWSFGISTDGVSFVEPLGARPIVEPLVPYGVSGATDRRVHLYLKAAALYYARYVRISVTQTSASLPPLRAGILVVNRCFQSKLP